MHQEGGHVPMHPMMAGITTEIIQQYLDENKQLILAILEYYNAGKAAESNELQTKLQQNLTYLAAVADNQAQLHTPLQTAPNAAMQQTTGSMTYQQPQHSTPHSAMAACSSVLCAQQQQGAMQGQLALGSGANIGFNMNHNSDGRLDCSGGQSEEGNEPSLYLRGPDEEEN